MVTELIYEYLADVGPGMNTIGDAGFVKGIASSWKWNADSTAISFEINPAARWQDGYAVTAKDVAFSFATYTSAALASPSASSLADIDSVTMKSPVTVVFWFKRKTPHQFYDAAAQMLILPAHLLEQIPADSLRTRAAALTPVGSGKFRFAGWHRGESFEVRAVENHYRGRSNADRIVWIVSPDYNAALIRLTAAEADVMQNVRVESLEQLRKRGTFNIVSLPGMDYVFLQFNLRRPLLASRDLRRALTMSLDRESMVKNLFDTLAAVPIGPTVRAYPTSDTAIATIPYDTVAASRILDSLGWRRSGPDGMRRKDGKSLSFTLILPSTSAARKRIAAMIQEQLRRAGVSMKVEEMDYQAFADRQSNHKFDGALAGWHLPSSTESVKGAWTSGGSENYGRYSNSIFDALVDSALSASSVDASRGFFRRAYQIIVDDAPGIWLYEPRTLIAINKRIQTTPMRPSAWWLDMSSWGLRPK
jgi:peptide/nickel transport system substrate-binding protein